MIKREQDQQMAEMIRNLNEETGLKVTSEGMSTQAKPLSFDEIRVNPDVFKNVRAAAKRASAIVAENEQKLAATKRAIQEASQIKPNTEGFEQLRKKLC